MAASSRAEVLRIYRVLLRESQRFAAYGYRCGPAGGGRRPLVVEGQGPARREQRRAPLQGRPRSGVVGGGWSLPPSA